MRIRAKRRIGQRRAQPEYIPFIRISAADAGDSDGEVSFFEGMAQVIHPGEGTMLEGELLDCPEREPGAGWVVLCVEGKATAAGSPMLRELVIENSPCRLRLESVRRCTEDGQYWDWTAFELSPTGCVTMLTD